jgi:L-carnitine CoA-transferase
MSVSTDIPKFGALQGLKVVHTSTALAGPFAADLMADYGADVLWIENALAPDPSRTTPSIVDIDRRNQRNISLNILSPQGREIFLKLLKDADILIEASKGGQYKRWGLTDEVLWQTNPKLVIVHISGYGQEGDDRYIKRPAYDATAQAYGCYMQFNGFPDRGPIPAVLWQADYFAGFFAVTAALSSVIRAKDTGLGESIDVAQFEALLRVQSYFLMDYLNSGKKPVRTGGRSTIVAGWGSYTCKDGKEVYITCGSEYAVKSIIPLIGLEYGSPLFPEKMSCVFLGSPAEIPFEEKLKAFCRAHDAKEVERLMTDANVPCCVIYDYDMAVADPHYKARKVFIEWDDVAGKKIKGPTVVPRFKNNPGRIWRGAPTIGMDNESVLHELGLADEEIKKLYDLRVITKMEQKKSATR